MSNLSDTFKVDYPEDVQKIRAAMQKIAYLRQLSDAEIDMLYSRYSSSVFCAGWMTVTEQRLEDFIIWVQE